MQREDVERVKAEVLTREDEYGEAWVLASDYAELLDRAGKAEAERDAAFAAGQESMRERAALEAERGLASAPNRDGEMMQAIAEGIRDLPIKPRP